MPTDIDCLVFSKDRAMQLDAFLRSAEEHAPYASVTVLSPNTRETDASYWQVSAEHDPVWWIEEGGTIEPAVRCFLALHERVVFHTDDEVFFRTPPADLFDCDSATVITLRQGRNTTWCHPLSCEQAVPEHFPWKWRDAEKDFGYPLSVNATIYRSADLLPLLDFHFTNPTEFEAALACHHRTFAPEWMTAPEHSCTVSLPHNVVSVSSNCPRGETPEWQPAALCAAYLEGWRIDLDAMDFSHVTAAHQEIPLKFKRGKERR